MDTFKFTSIEVLKVRDYPNAYLAYTFEELDITVIFSSQRGESLQKTQSSREV